MQPELKKQLTNKPKSIAKMLFSIHGVWIFTISCQFWVFLYYEFVVYTLDISYAQKEIYMIVSIILWFLYPIVVLAWAILFRRKAKKEPQLNLFRKYLFNLDKQYWLDLDDHQKEEIGQLGSKYLKSNLNWYSYFLHLIATFSTLFIIISLVIANASKIHLILLSVFSIVLFWIPSYLNLYLLIKYRHAKFVIKNTITHKQ